MTLTSDVPPGFGRASVPLRRIYSIASDTSEKCDESKLNGEVVCHFSIPNVQSVGSGVLEDGSSIDSDKLLIRTPAVLISKLNPRKSTITLAAPGSVKTVCSTEFVVLATGNAIDNKYLEYVLRTTDVSSFLHARVESATRSHQRVEPGLIRRMAVPWPSGCVRENVVKYLDRETAEIDAFIADCESMSSMISERFEAVRDQAVRPSILDPVPLRRIARLQTGSTPADLDEALARFGLPWVKPGDVSEGRLSLKTSNYLNEAGVKAVSVVPKGSTLVVGIGATVGKSCYATEDCATNQQISAVIPSGNTDSAYLYYALQSNREWVKANANGTTLPIINNSVLGDLPVYVPSTDVQRAVSEKLDTEFSALEKLQNDLEKAIYLAGERRSALISAAVTGEIDIR